MSVDESNLCGELITYASAMVRTQVPNWAFADETMLRLVCVNMVLRVMRNLAGVKTESVGPYAVTYDATVMAGYLTITTSELQLLAPPMVSTSTPAKSIRVRAGLASPALEFDQASRAAAEWSRVSGG